MPLNPCFIENASNHEIDLGIEKMKAVDKDFVNKFWRHTKDNYTAKGVLYPEARVMLAKEFGIPERAVARILDHNKQVRVVAEDVAKMQATNRKFLSQNRRYIADISKSDVAKGIEMISDGVRGSLLALHGPVISAIHPIDIAFTAGRQGSFIRQYIRSVKAWSKDTTREILTRMKTDDPVEFEKWKKAGMPLEEHIEGGHVGGWGGRAMDAALKPLMLELGKQMLEKEPPQYREMMRSSIATDATLAAGGIPTGILGHGALVKAFSWVQLARSLNTARWMKTTILPAKTIATYTQAALAWSTKKLPLKFQRPSPSIVDRRNASRRTKNAGRWAGTMIGALILNDQVSRMLGGQRVNFTDPKRGDYMAFKITIPGLGQYYIRTRGSMEVISFLARLIQAGKPYMPSVYGERTPEHTAGQYFEYKMTPTLSLGKELSTGKDVFGRPVPWSTDKGTKFAPRYSSYLGGQSNSLKDRVLRGISSPEYAFQHFPIFLGHGVSAFYEGMREAGINPRDARAIIRGVQQHPSLVLRPLTESAGEFVGLNLQRVHGAKPYVPPGTQQKLERQYLPKPIQ